MNNVRGIRYYTLNGPPMSDRWRSGPMLYNRRTLVFTDTDSMMLGDYLGKSWLKKVKDSVKKVGRGLIKAAGSLGPLTPLLAVIPGVGIIAVTAAGAAAAAAKGYEVKRQTSEMESQVRKDIRAEDAILMAEEKAYQDSVLKQQSAVNAAPAVGPTGQPLVRSGVGGGLPLIVAGAALAAGLLLFNKRR